MKKILYGLLGTWIIFAAVTVLPPVYKAIRGLCPMRSDIIKTASAVPNFARKYKLSCTACHSAWPALNAQGRQFRLNGYRMDRGEKTGMRKVAGMEIPKVFPMAGALVKLRPYDKKQSSREFKHRPLHEMELFLAGNVGSDLSYIAEFEMEDEKNNAGGEAFRVDLAMLQAGWHPKEWGNAIMAYRGFYDMDPYQTATNHGRLTVSRRVLAGISAIGGQSVGGNRQTSLFYGEVAKEDVGSLYYAAGLTSDKEDGEGEGGKIGNLRIMLDNLRGIAIGAFTSIGTVGKVEKANQPAGVIATTKRYDTQLFGIDSVVELAGLTARAAFLTQTDIDRFVTTGAGTKSTEKAAYLELMYPFMKDGRPIFVPSIRQDWSTSTNGRDHAADFTVQLATYFKPNAKAFVEYWTETNDTHNGTGAQPKNHRLTGQIEFGF